MVSKEADRAENTSAASPALRAKLVFFYSERSGRSRRVEGYLAQVLQRRRTLRRPPAKDVGTPPPYAAAYADVLPAITYLDECFSTIADGEPGQSYADTPIGSYLPQRYEHYYDGRFARDWATTVAVVGWKLAQPGYVTLACVAEELALFALIRQAQVLLDLRELENDEQAWSDFRDLAFEDEDFLFLFNSEFDGIEESDWAREHAVVGLKFNEWFRPFDAASHGAPHPFALG